MLSDEEKVIFGKVAWTIIKKGHLVIQAIVRFTPDARKKDVKKFIRLGLLKKHRTDTFELSPLGRSLANKYNSRLQKNKNPNRPKERGI
jgi:hypothetical protein